MSAWSTEATGFTLAAPGSRKGFPRPKNIQSTHIWCYYFALFHYTIPRTMKLKTAAAVRAEFNFKGESISDWALARGFSPNQVFNVLAGRNKGKRGRSHKIGVLLCLLRIIERRDVSPGNQDQIWRTKSREKTASALTTGPGRRKSARLGT